MLLQILFFSLRIHFGIKMSFSENALFIACKLQSFLPFPSSFDHKNRIFSPNSLYKSVTATYLRYVITVLVILSTTFHFILVIVSLLNWKNYGAMDFLLSVEAVICCSVFFVCSMATYVNHQFCAEISYAMNSLLAALVDRSSWLSFLGSKRYFLHLCAFALPSLGCSFFFTPFTPNFDTIFENASWFVKLVAGLGHGLATMYIAVNFFWLHGILFALLLKVLEYIQNWKLGEGIRNVSHQFNISWILVS